MSTNSISSLLPTCYLKMKSTKATTTPTNLYTKFTRIPLKTWTKNWNWKINLNQTINSPLLGRHQTIVCNASGTLKRRNFSANIDVQSIKSHPNNTPVTFVAWLIKCEMLCAFIPSCTLELARSSATFAEKSSLKKAHLNATCPSTRANVAINVRNAASNSSTTHRSTCIIWRTMISGRRNARFVAFYYARTHIWSGTYKFTQAQSPTNVRNAIRRSRSDTIWWPIFVHTRGYHENGSTHALYARGLLRRRFRCRSTSPRACVGRMMEIYWNCISTSQLNLRSHGRKMATYYRS